MNQSDKKLTPLMQQYWEVKNQHPDKIILFRMGDFFEMFHQDAVEAAPIINISLTKRNKKSQDETPMCGVPHHSIAGPISKLLAAGKKIAICDQIEDPKLAKGLVKRAVTRCLSPGMVYDPETLDESNSNYICAFDDHTMSFFDSTTNDHFYYKIDKNDQRLELLNLLRPVEILITNDQKMNWNYLEANFSCHQTDFALSFDVETLLENNEFQGVPKSAIMILDYCSKMQGEKQIDLKSINFVEKKLDKTMILTPSTLNHLEVFETYRGDVNGSLFASINRTKTSAGTRLLKSWLKFPLIEVKEIEGRSNKVEQWIKKSSELKKLRSLLSQMGDIERRLSKISMSTCSPRDLIALSDSLNIGLCLNEFCDNPVENNTWEQVTQLASAIQNTLSDDPPLSTKDGGFIKKGVHAQLDELITLSENSQDLVNQLESRERESTQINSLKIRYNNVFGFYIEVTNTHKEKVPNYYQRKQTLTNAERYTTDELNDLEKKVITAKSKRVELEKQIFENLRTNVLDLKTDILILTKIWSELDVVSSLAWLALEKRYRKPSFSKISGIELSSCRHPVLEDQLGGKFVSNDISIQQGGCFLITGPNMAGKSTIMRQVALISILAQMGSFVPAESAVLPIFDQVFTRIGASDFLIEGLSTFMVEMKETANIITKATKTSLIIMDEIGRGTSTYDGMCLAQAILEFILNNTHSITFFATHYHELTQLVDDFDQLKNVHMSISEKGSDVQFLHTLVDGPAEKSYGIHVAKLAGIPKTVTSRAQQLLNKLEKQNIGTKKQQLSFDDFNFINEKIERLDNGFNEDLKDEKTINSLPSVNSHEKEIINEIKNTQINDITPFKALELINNLKNRLHDLSH